MKNVVFVVGGLVLGGFISGFAVKRHYDEVLLWGLYMDSAADIKKQVAILTELREGKKEKAISYLDNFLVTDEAILNGCKNDLCRGHTYPKFVEALKISRAYRQKYNIN